MYAWLIKNEDSKIPVRQLKGCLMGLISGDPDAHSRQVMPFASKISQRGCFILYLQMHFKIVHTYVQAYKYLLKIHRLGP